MRARCVRRGRDSKRALTSLSLPYCNACEPMRAHGDAERRGVETFPTSPRTDFRDFTDRSEYVAGNLYAALPVERWPELQALPERIAEIRALAPARCFFDLLAPDPAWVSAAGSLAELMPEVDEDAWQLGWQASREPGGPEPVRWLERRKLIGVDACKRLDLIERTYWRNNGPFRRLIGLIAMECALTEPVYYRGVMESRLMTSHPKKPRLQMLDERAPVWMPEAAHEIVARGYGPRPAMTKSKRQTISEFAQRVAEAAA